MGLTLAQIASGDLLPPGDTFGLVGAWTEGTPVAIRARMTTIYKDLVTDADWPEGPLRMYLSPNAFWDYVDRAVQYNYDDDPPTRVEWDSNSPYFVYNARWYYNGQPLPQGQGLSPGVNTGALNPDFEDDTPENRLVEAGSILQWHWCAYLTRCKIGMARATQFAYSPGPTEYHLFAPENMSYDSVSSWYRVNKYVRANAALKSMVEGYGPLTAAAARMDAALSDFASQTGVELPSGSTSVAGNRFPVPKAWWGGRLPSWYETDASGGHQTLDTSESAKAFRDAAGDFRVATGAAFGLYVLTGHHLDGSPAN